MEIQKDFSQSVFSIVAAIPAGRVMTYGQVAALAGKPRAAQMVGWILHRADQSRVPYQRVVNRFGSLAAGYTNGGPDGHRADLLAEGIDVGPDGTIDLQRYIWWPEEGEFKK